MSRPLSRSGTSRASRAGSISRRPAASASAAAGGGRKKALDILFQRVASARSLSSAPQPSRKDKQRARQRMPILHVYEHCQDENVQAAHVRRFRGWSGWRLLGHDIQGSNWFKGFIMLIILLNTVLIALQVDDTTNIDYGWYFSLVDSIFLAIYLVELSLKFLVFRMAFFSSPWNNFDLFVVIMSILDLVWSIVMGSLSGFNPKIFRLLRVFRAVRAFRALRVLRTITFFQNLQIIVTTLVRSIPAWGSISLLLFLVIYIFAIIGTTLYSDVNPEKFGNLFRSGFTLVQLITLDDWFAIYASMKDVPGGSSSIAYFMIYIVLETFTFVQLFVAVIVSNLDQLQTENVDRQRKKREKQKAELHRRNSLSLNFERKLKRVSLTDSDKKPAHGEDFVHELGDTPRQRELSSSLLQHLASLEHNLDDYQNQQKLLDDLVDISSSADVKDRYLVIDDSDDE